MGPLASCHIVMFTKVNSMVSASISLEVKDKSIWSVCYEVFDGGFALTILSSNCVRCRVFPYLSYRLESLMLQH